MTNEQRLHLSLYCVTRFESNGIKLSFKSVRNIINYVSENTKECEFGDELTSDQLMDIWPTFFELHDIELAECISSDLVEPI
jgi:hypothetical protein